MKRISAQQYAKALFEAVNEKDADIHAIAKNCIRLLVRERNMRRMPKILKALEALYAQKGLYFQVELRTASMCVPSEMQAWQEKLEKNLKSQLQMNIIHDPQLLGGAIIKIHNTVYDGSMKNAIVQLQSQFVSKSENFSKA
ncbi:MAG: hypothetical protein A3B74_04340 [Candidatus Kerfeldbacteria bacterium RIFCSPHIGHO2_02_FULL_42_14]|uniref:ATP synthase subunit delta n=1 Tax=Candidatus Kerfeldbacteria bacterium RIFCSPHIGHO2_02_FULL_42_14 TaxID=1798540 RepID=A0A1G2ANX3_9BACT|nr:MAG: hypothetical protein A3B74_04340 [Candidatus Kerfeldbacteria bacterium RIFCSPHIGHO2_02_FULL_42_14]OGY80836.1 MAG: hypothetical protein A3E60_01485 [Candidatus Kerfeldbacteria bacterium RIFCSPHIGHO2_12_FULL_42_13]OGY85008.1 MAG: hypothetical protein A3I91_00820 [Candidatus Kerfeldbacteria bacterium RIFCSPLOWO2_02_FULL_42_19]OGY86902.1 MAG: hypothetical protein A3G01_04465 [Candidatus Kerfeldbacteria bacterium RIFCSPLOWO2_12_FULL_43_9]